MPQLNTKIRPAFSLWLALIVAAAIFLATVNYQKNALHWLSYGVITIIVLISYMGWKKIKSANWKVKLPDAIYDDESITVKIVLNDEDVTDTVLALLEKKTSIYANQIEYTFSNPGIYQLKLFPWRFDLGYGFWQATVELKTSLEILVYPRPIDHLASNVANSTNDFEGIRQYLNGDSMRRILKKTQMLPQTQWQVQTASQSTIEDNTNILKYETLPSRLSKKEKFQQLAYFIRVLNDTTIFCLDINNVVTPKGMGKIHKIYCLTQLAKSWNAIEK